MPRRDTAAHLEGGLALHDHLPLEWVRSSLQDTAELEHCNFETGRALQALALFEESPREVAPDVPPGDLMHLEAKVDVLLSLVSRLLAERHGFPPRHGTVLRPETLEFVGPAADQAQPGDTGVLVLYPNAVMPLPFRLPARVAGTVDRNGQRWRIARFEHLTPLVSVGIEKLVFRRHRRQIALSRGTDVFSRTGIHRVPKS